MQTDLVPNLGPSEDEGKRYTRQSILRSEELYGRGFQSPGGQDTVAEFAATLNITRQTKILDLGSGVGGAALYFAEKFGSTVVGIDASADMIAMSKERLRERNLASVTFLEGRVEDLQLEPDQFDIAWTRDSIVCIQDKHTVWRNVYRTMKPGGKLFATDFCKGRRPLSKEFAAYASQCAYYLQNLDEYVTSLEAAGFHDVRAEDLTSRFIALLQEELARFETHKDEFVRRNSENDFKYMQERWRNKIHFSKQGDLVWGKLKAAK